MDKDRLFGRSIGTIDFQTQVCKKIRRMQGISTLKIV